MTRTFDIAVVGVSGLVGAAMLEILHEREFPIGKLYPLDVADAAGGSASFGRRDLPVGDVAGFDFSQVQIALFSAGAAVAAQYAPKAAVEGCVVIDNSAAFRLDPEVPLVVPEVNPEALANYDKRGIVANPTCTVTLLALALKPLLDAAGIERVNVVTYQAVSGSGREAVEELGRQTADLLSFREVKPKAYPKQIAFNLLPLVGALDEDGHSAEELRLRHETARILGDALRVNATAVRVPVFYGHSAAVHLETREPLAAARARELLGQAPGLELLDEPTADGFPTPVSEASGQDAVFVGRVRQDPENARGLNLWLTGDNIRKGAALNAVQIAEQLSRDYL
jgi:aspartate-semialdehyde dehydrogenase